MSEFSELFKNTKIEKEITFRQISEKTGLSIAYLCDIAAGRKAAPERETVIKLQEILGITGRALEIADLNSRKPTYSESQQQARTLEQIKNALCEYHQKLDNREHGGLADAALARAIEKILGRQWYQGISKQQV